jgi:AAA domain-containing protein
MENLQLIKNLNDLPETDNIKTLVDPEKYRIDPTQVVSEPPVILKIGESPIFTAGNFSMINGKAKSGKTFFTGAIVASFINPEIQQLSCIFSTPQATNINALYFDTEQSTYHATRTIKRICEMAEKDNPDNLYAYALRPLKPSERLEIIEEKIYSTENVGLIIIDGIRDLLTIGINDEEEATSITSKFLKWTSDKNTHLVVLLHQNKTDLNARGHVGTEALNKAETTISVTKSQGNAFTVSCEYSRDISFDDFAFTITEGLATESDLPSKGQTPGKTPFKIDIDEHWLRADKIYSESDKLSYKELIDAICYQYEVGESKARTFIIHFIAQKIVYKDREGKNVYYKKLRRVLGNNVC